MFFLIAQIKHEGAIVYTSTDKKQLGFMYKELKENIHDEVLKVQLIEGEVLEEWRTDEWRTDK